jgi:DNA-binding NarL/FixJ family response regulator
VTIRVLLADDQALVRGGLRMILEAEDDMEVVAEAGDGEEAIDRCRRHRVDVVLMDVRMPRLDGVAATRRLRQLAGDASPAVLMLTTYDTDEHVYDALRAGASGFLLKDTRPEHLAEAVRVVARGEALLAPTVTRRLVERYAHRAPDPECRRVLDSLSARERDVLVLLARGLSNAEIAGRMILGEATVKTHVSSLLRKASARDRAQLVVLAYESGAVEPGR